MKVKFTALSINSTHMNMVITFRRVITPTVPMTNKIVARVR